MDKQFVQIQLALFFQSDFQGQFENISLSIKENFGTSFNPQIMGLPTDAPSEIPRLVVNSENLNINVSKNRLDFFSKNKDFITTEIEKIFLIIKKMSVKIGRVGIVVTYFKPIALDEVKILLNQSIISGLNLNEINVRLNEVIEIDEIKTNNAQSYVSGNALDPEGVKREVVVITKDINTLQEDIQTNEFTKEKLAHFAQEAILLAEQSIL